MDELTIKIPLVPVTKKNSQQLIIAGGKPRIIPSEKFRQYQTDCLKILPFKKSHISAPCEVTARFYMPNRRRVDLVNLLEALDDVLVAADILADDNCGVIVSHDGSRVLIDRENPRTEVEIKILEV